MRLNEEQAKVLNITQQVLRLVVVIMAKECGADMGKLSELLSASAMAPGLDATAKNMLNDLASGLGGLGGMGVRRN